MKLNLLFKELITNSGSNSDELINSDLNSMTKEDIQETRKSLQKQEQETSKQNEYHLFRLAR